MGTFHDNLGELHGITVVVDTHGPRVYIGRCHTETDAGILLVDADQHEDGDGGKSKQEYIQKSARFGVWKKFASLEVPRSEIASVVRLGEVEIEG